MTKHTNLKLFIIPKFHSEILAFINFNKNKMLSPGLDNNHTFTEMLFWQFSNIIIYVKIVERIPDQQLSVWLFSNPGEKVPFLLKVLHLFGPSPLDLRITIHTNVDLAFFQQSWHLWLCWKIATTTFQCLGVIQSRGQHFIIVKIYWSQDLRVEHKHTY